jgi:type II secretory pathway pseudopilin PulG
LTPPRPSPEGRLPVAPSVTQTAWVRRFGPSRPFPPSPAQRAVRWQRLTLAIVVIVLLCLVALPQSERRARRRLATQEAWMVKEVLAEFRRGIQAYGLDHGRPPGFEAGAGGTACAEALEQQLLLPTNRAGEWGPGYALGPYLPEGLPANPINGHTSVRVLGSDEPWPLSADGTHGWIYDPRTGLLRLDADGRVPVLGVRYFDL